MIDGGSGGTAVEALRSYNLTAVHTVVVSHADDDHLGGVLTMLLDPAITIGQILINPDPTKETVGWTAFKMAAREARAKGTQFRVGATTDTAVDWGNGEHQFEVLAPSPTVALAGVGGHDLEDRPITTNSLSIVVRVVRDGIPLVLFAGDIDGVGLDDLLSEHPGPIARLLVFPHHGGLPGGAEAREFATRLCAAVKPNAVLFSIGRGRHGTPRPEIVEGVKEATPEAYVVCTQLSERCAPELPMVAAAHLAEKPAKGRPNNSCCGGTIVLAVQELTCLAQATRLGHTQFVDDNAPTALCRRPVPQAALFAV